MSIQSEITRITTARNNSFNAISAKGVTVPVDSTIDDIPTLIGQIPSGQGSGVVVTDTTDSHGGTIRNINSVVLNGDTVTPSTLKQGITAHNALGQAITGTATDLSLWHWMGVDTELVDMVYNQSIPLSETLFATWTPSTTAKTLKATESLPVIAIDTANYDYYIRWVYDVPIKYKSGTAMAKATALYQCGELFTGVFKRRGISSNGSVTPSATANWTVTVMNSSTLCVYHTSATAVSNINGISYGFYLGLVAPTFSNATADNVNLTIKTPTLNCRCSTTYLSTAKCGAIDQSTPFNVTGYLYRCKPIGMVRSVWDRNMEKYSQFIGG